MCRVVGSCVAAAVVAIACAQADHTGDVPVTDPAPSISAQSDGNAQQRVIDSLQAAGDAIYTNDHIEASALWSKALGHSSAIDDSARIALALTGLSRAARQVGDLALARKLGEQALGIKKRLGMDAHLFMSYNTLGLIAWNEQRLADATTLFELASQAAMRMQDSLSLAKPIMNLGLVARDRGAFDAARAKYAQGGALAAAWGDSVTAVRTLNNLAELELALGNAREAITTLDRVRVLALAAGDSLTEVNAMGQLALAYNGLGEPQKAFALLDSALAIARRRGYRQEEAANISLIAGLFGEAGNHQHALDYYGRALAAFDTSKSPDERGNIHRSMARSYAALGQLPRALEFAISARDIHRGSGGLAYSEFADLLLLARLSQQAGKAADARQALKNAGTLADGIDVPAAHAFLAITSAAVALDAGQPRVALTSLDRARASLSRVGYAAVAEALHLEARAHAAVGNRVAAIAAGQRAIEAVERVRGTYASGELRTSFASNHAELFEAHALRLLQGNRREEAFAVADAARGRALIEHLASVTSEAGVQGDATQLFEEDRLLRRIDALALVRSQSAPATGVRSSPGVPVPSELEDSLAAAQREYALMVARTGGSRRLSIAGSSKRASLAQIQSALRRDEVLLEYLVTRERLLIFAVTRTGLTVHEVDETAAALSKRVALVRGLVEQRGRQRDARPVLQELHRTLIAPVARANVLKGATRIIIVPHGALTYLPFPALVDASTQRYLMEDYALLRLPTSASLPVLRDAAAFSASIRQLPSEVFAPLPDSLPGTRREAAIIRELRPNVRTHIGNVATESVLRSALARSALVHVASHASMNGRNPLFSHVRLALPGGLARGSRRSVQDDGRLEVHELLGLRVASPLVFLSGCETGLGQSWATTFDTGEDYTTIAQTFLYAGARNVVATLWRVDDASSAEFAGRFYRALDSGDAGDALAKAQRAMQNDVRFRDPYFWAAYDIMGAGTLYGIKARKNVAVVR